MSNTITSELINLQNATAQTNAAKGRSSELDQDAFLQLMMIQLKNQDPTSPMDTSQFLSQQAQFTQISELQKLNSNLTSSTIVSQASSMVGREAVFQDTSASEGYVSGVVECASFDSSGNVTLVMNGKEYPLKSLMVLGGLAENSAQTEEN